MRTGRVCGTSASSAPSVTTSVIWQRWASSSMAAQYVRHLRCGSPATAMTRSRESPGARATEKSVLGHTISRSVSEPAL